MLEIMAKADDVLGFNRVIQFAVNRLVKFLDKPNRAVHADFRDVIFEQPRQQIQNVEVAFDFCPNRWALHFDDHFFAG